jgi:LmbE family N-acetylglucosaminyl deacetylase
MIVREPEQFFRGSILIVAPHMDDEALACGGLIALLPAKERIHVVYATDGMKSPAPLIPGVDAITPDLGEVRVAEAILAMTFLGVPAQNLHFLRLPEAELRKHLEPLGAMLSAMITEIKPDIILVPFRYDRHPDHLAINQVLTGRTSRSTRHIRFVEYFVYHRWRLLPKKDIRAYVKPEYLIEVDIQDVAEKKRAALDCYRSQTTIHYPWQTRPILTAALLDEESSTAEYFFSSSFPRPGTQVFTGARLWIPIAHRIEPVLQRWKYRVGAYVQRAFGIRSHA